ncbi:sodium:calcium antiporter [Geodermatophilus obscurus]|uniref:Sodium/calcium exchanger membrane region n=1 Tax=Geodermatophilus obscurus (strain ATCC 25078 / DSM 43160 / JCM 3152 / CCUG 61914 / KCC A-0152 / KCTC 9177 / NBRC 13315 / NRRL B-3577 / G-20) TaxID=526225 RepID=D2S4D8_GEOOG|nr:sodium/hydrogen exchanger [Geodermatophilus obscurus]ADB75128.1 sodium/calcium exchanger membrane region [Geodermatophilus obscurus DSM 43160]
MTSVFVFISGATLLVVSAEKLITHLVGAASGLRIPLFLLAIVFTGVEFDDIALGVGLNLEELSGVALGVVFGTALSFTGVVLAVAAIVRPSVVDIPRDYLVVFAAAPLVMVAFTLIGPLTVTDGLLLLGLFVLFIGYVAARELRRSVAVFRDEEVCEAAVAEVGDGTPPRRGADTHVLQDQPAGAAARPGAERTQQVVDEPRAEPSELPAGWAHLGLAVVALAGLIVGAATVSTGTEGILETYGLEGTVFGATIVTAVLTMEDVFLTVEPFRRGVPEIGVGNVIGSVVFSVTGKLGITLLAGGIVVGSDVFTWHLPALVVLTALAAYLLSTGRLTRWHGCILLALYVVYWLVSLVAFGEVPVEMD